MMEKGMRESEHDSPYFNSVAGQTVRWDGCGDLAGKKMAPF